MAEDNQHIYNRIFSIITLVSCFPIRSSELLLSDNWETIYKEQRVILPCIGNGTKKCKKKRFFLKNGIFLKKTAVIYSRQRTDRCCRPRQHRFL